MVVNSQNIEFGYELIAALPYAYWLHLNGKLEKTISGYDTECLYWFSPKHEINPAKRSFNNTRKAKNLPNIQIHRPKLDFSKWYPPPLQQRFSNNKFVYDKPILCVCNKYCSEWLRSPVNFLDIGILRELFEVLTPHYEVIYFNIRGKHDHIDDDEQYFIQDYDLCREFKVKTIHELHAENPELSFNTIQLMVMANCRAFITLNGGYSQMVSYMGGTNIIYSKQCREIRPGVNSFYRWYYKFGGSRVVHVADYNDLLAKVKSIYVLKKPLINILIRTSGRPNYFRNCMESIYGQDYHNWNVIVGVDDPESLQYVQPHKCKVVEYDYSDYQIPPRPAGSEYGRKFKYNLYFNELHKHVNEGYILYLDDDNMLAGTDSLSMLAVWLSEDSVLFFRVQFPQGRIVPCDNNFGKPPVMCDIDTAGFCFHHSNAPEWEPYKLGDYRAANKLWEKTGYPRFLDEIIIKLQRENGIGGFGKRDDLPDKFTCPICSWSGNELRAIGLDLPVLKDVIGAGRRAAGCPGCGSSDRERLVYLFLLEYGIFNQGKNKKILHVAPEKRIYKKLMAFGFSGYIPCDLDMPGMEKIDITDTSYSSGHFDLIICNHVLEHVPDDFTAIRELHRILKKGGTALLQVPLRTGKKTYENVAITDPDERLTHFGQADHVRIYGMDDYCKRLGISGFYVEKINIRERYPKSGLNKDEILIIGKKL